MQLFRVRGIPVRVDLGWVLIFALLSWSLAAGYFPSALPMLSPAAYWAQGVTAALLLFASVLLHELAHALVATDHGVAVSGITLHLFGGVSQLDDEPPTPRAEALIAVVGPLTSFAIAGVSVTAGRVLDGPPWAGALASYLGTVNLLVGAFNLLPGFPLDGGRVLRAALWWWSGRYDWATRLATRVGSGLAFTMVAVGIARLLTGDAVGGVWLALIGLFVHQAARSTWTLIEVRRRLEPVPVSSVMTSPPVSVEADAPLADVVTREFTAHRVSAFPVQSGRRLVGFLPWAHVEKRAGELARTTAADAMLPLDGDLVVGRGDSAWAAYRKIARNRVGRVAVVDAGLLVGVVSQRDLQHVLAVESLRAGADRRAA